MEKRRYLIIGGVTKAGTTSLFKYLVDHPDTCGASVKETCFFLDADLPRTSLFRFEDGLEKYDTFYGHCREDAMRLEATPVYLFSPGTPHKIKCSLPDVKLVFILREPIDRLVSFYRFNKQNNQIPPQVTFEEYVRHLFENIDNRKKSASVGPENVLERGRYSKYLKRYFDVFERDQLCVVFFEALKRDPTSVLVEICHFAGISPTFFQGYSFPVFHRSLTVKNPAIHSTYLSFRRGIRTRVHDKPKIATAMRAVQARWEPLYHHLIGRRNNKVEISESLRALLEQYYADEPASLARLLDTARFSWELL
jgi:hypothetical protein